MMTSSGDVLASSSEEKRIESGGSACPLSELPLSRGAHRQHPPVASGQCAPIPDDGPVGSCLTYRPLKHNQYVRHVAGLSSGGEKARSRAWTEWSNTEWRVSIHAQRTHPTESFCRKRRCLLALCPLADSRRQRQRRTALESGTW